MLILVCKVDGWYYLVNTVRIYIFILVAYHQNATNAAQSVKMQRTPRKAF